MAPIGLAIPRPAMSGAEPWTGSNSPGPFSPRLAEGSIPSEPVSIAASSLRMSPKRFSVRITSKRAGPATSASDLCEYSVAEVQRIARVAFEAARTRRNRVHSVDKANVLETSRQWGEVVHRVHAEEYDDVELADILVDNAAMQLVARPADFDVIVTENLFGDILSDEAAMITGSIGMLPSARLGPGTLGLYEPVHGSAPDIAGQGIANPIATLLSAAMMLRYSLGATEAADRIDAAVDAVLDAGHRTRDLGGDLGTRAVGDLILGALEG